MKNKAYIHPATFFFLLSVFLTFFSWIGSGLGWNGIQNLLSVDGVRWILRHAQENYMYSPALAITCMLFFGVGLMAHSGLGEALHRWIFHERKLSRKQKRALVLSGLTACFYISVCCLLIWGPWGIVRSVTGHFEGSPLEDGLLVVISVGFGLSGIVYGFAVDNYRRDKDVYHGMAYLFATLPEYFVSLFFIEQFFAALDYSGFLLFLGIAPEWELVIYAISCIYPIFLAKKYYFLH